MCIENCRQMLHDTHILHMYMNIRELLLATDIEDNTSCSSPSSGFSATSEVKWQWSSAISSGLTQLGFDDFVPCFWLLCWNNILYVSVCYMFEWGARGTNQYHIHWSRLCMQSFGYTYALYQIIVDWNISETQIEYIIWLERKGGSWQIQFTPPWEWDDQVVPMFQLPVIWGQELCLAGSWRNPTTSFSPLAGSVLWCSSSLTPPATTKNGPKSWARRRSAMWPSNCWRGSVGLKKTDGTREQNVNRFLGVCSCGMRFLDVPMFLLMIWLLRWLGFHQKYTDMIWYDTINDMIQTLVEATPRLWFSV